MALNILIAVTHLLGVGHLTRAAAIGRALAARRHKVTLASGGNPAPLVRLDNLNLVQLPPLHIAGTAFSRLLDERGEAADPSLLAARRTQLLTVLQASTPDVVITELFPFGRRVLSDEYIELLTTARRARPRPLFLCSIRDILVAPTQRERIVAAHQRLNELYDGVLVHGDPEVVSLERSWPLDPTLTSRLYYTGYVDDGATLQSLESGSAEGEILVSAGGGAAGRVLYATAVAAAALVADRPWRILVGGGVPQGDFESLQSRAPGNVTVERARGDFRALLSRCAVSISQLGYNTAVDLLAARPRAIVVPFAEGGESEQLERAQCFAARGLLSVLSAKGLDPKALADAVRRSLSGPRPTPSGIRTDGLAETVRIVERLAASTNPSRVSHAPRAGWQDLRDELTRLADAGRSVTFWWRDDDAVEPTPALERLLGLARRFDFPVAIAAVPTKLTRTLGERLAAEPLASPLVHGLAHENHAPPDEKKSEFGPHRPVDRLIADAAQALAAARAGLGYEPEPVFVPPWNRLAADLVPRLGALGYKGLSAFGTMAQSEPAPGLTQINVHIDPIDWRGGRRLRCESDIIATVLRALADCGRNAMDKAQPVGLLTHHLVHTEDAWTFCERLLESLAGRPGIAMAGAPKLFGSASTG
jgi:predicted glycosyltransferase